MTIFGSYALLKCQTIWWILPFCNKCVQNRAHQNVLGPR